MRRVIDTTSGIAGAYAAKMLGDAGAEIVLLEQAGGHPLRRWTFNGPPSDDNDGALFAYLRHGHRSVTALADHDLDSADAVLVERDGPLGDPAVLRHRLPHAVVTSISPYGLHGPMAADPWSELVLQAGDGSLGARGRAPGPPVQMGGHVTEWVSGAYAAVATAAAWRSVARTSDGELIDLSMLEVGNVTSTLFFDIAHWIRGAPDVATLPPARSFETPSIEPTADGFVGFNTNTRLQFEAFVLLIERPELLDDVSWASPLTRQQRWDEWNEIVRSWTRRHTTAEIVELAAALRIPVAPVGDAESILALDHLIERGVYIDDPTGRFRMPRRPWTLDGVAAPLPVPAPALGSSNGLLGPHVPIALAAVRSVAPATRQPARPSANPAGVSPAGASSAGAGSAIDASTAGASSAGASTARAADSAALAAERAPLHGVRVLDLTAWWAGPSCTAMLGALGADVIHVESTGHPDGIRMAGAAFFDRPSWWDLSSIFIQANTNKRGITLDLATPAGRELLLRLVAQCDVIVENFTPRVLEQLGLGWEVLHSANPRAVLVRMPAFGLDGPWRDRPGFAQTMEQLTGLAWVTGFPDDQPRIQRGPCDPNAGMHAAFATLTALEACERTGIGCLVEVPMVEAALNIAAEVVIEWTAYGNRLERMGNRSHRAAPQGVYRCLGADSWVAVSVCNDVQWEQARFVVGVDDDPRFATDAGRREFHDELDGLLAEWCGGLDAAEAAARLSTVGVPAAVVHDPRISSSHPQIAARRFVETVEHPSAGPLPIPGVPFRFASVDRWLYRPPPMLGEHNAEVLGELAGCSPDDLAALTEAGVIGTRPKGM